MKVIFLTASTSRSAGGLYFTITELTKTLYAKGIDVSIVGFDDESSDADRVGFGDVPVIPYHLTNIPGFKTFGYSPDLMNILENLNPDIIHLQGLWMYHSWAALKYRKKHPEVKIVIEPHGMLDEWAVRNSAWKKKIVGYIFEFENLRKADCFHALCNSELQSIRNFGLKNPVAIIPNGIRLPKNRSINKKNIIQYVGRIHPKKGLDLIVEAVLIIQKTKQKLLTGWKVRIAGWNQNGYQEKLEQKISNYKISEYFEFSGPRFGLDKEVDLAESKAFILPSYSEGLPMSVLEAWSYGLPVIMSKFCNLQEGFDAEAAIEVEITPESVADGIMQIISSSNENLYRIGLNGRNLVSRSFNWAFIADETIKMYKQL